MKKCHKKLSQDHEFQKTLAIWNSNVGTGHPSKVLGFEVPTAAKMSMFVRFQVLTVANMKMIVLWDIAPCSLVGVDRRFRGEYCPHHQGDRPDVGIMHL
jgi:hypothetical protein